MRCLQCSRSFRGVFPPSEAYRSCLVFYEARWQASRGVNAVIQVSCGRVLASSHNVLSALSCHERDIRLCVHCVSLDSPLTLFSKLVCIVTWAQQPLSFTLCIQFSCCMWHAAVVQVAAAGVSLSPLLSWLTKRSMSFRMHDCRCSVVRYFFLGIGIPPRSTIEQSG